MSRHKLYAIFFDRDDKSLWVMARNERRAKTFGKRVKGLVMSMPLPPPGARAWDAPTFRAIADVVADFRPEE